MNKPSIYTRTLLWLWDGLSLNLILLLLSVILKRVDVTEGSDYFLYFLAMNLCWLISALATGLDSSNDWMDSGFFIKETFKSFLVSILL